MAGEPRTNPPQKNTKKNYAQALRSFNTLTQHYAHEPLAHLGRARVLELLAKKERSNQRVLEAIEAYKRYLAFGELVTSDQEFQAAGNSCIEHLRFMGELPLIFSLNLN